ncbi:MAG: hypothetical protein IT167_14460 [Bryobacterales bacterium]|nr:hypothetical protein [Bryobacterales bacterium]
MRVLPEGIEERHWLVNVIVFTRYWIHYGVLFLVFLCAIAAAARGVMGR